jgi:DNA-binding phage protein
MRQSVPYDDYLIESVKDRRLAEAYLNAALEEDNSRVFLLALRNVAQARGTTKLAARSGLNRKASTRCYPSELTPACKVSADGAGSMQ